jgi:hypothetical protein
VNTKRGILRAAKGEKNFGCVNLDAPEFKDVFNAVRGRPSTLQVQRVDPDALRSLSRPGRRRAIEALASKKVKIVVLNPRGLFYTKPDGDEVDLATVMILAIALRGKQHELVAELVGLSPVTVMKHLLKFCRPPFMRLADITGLVHSTARNIAHSHDGRTAEPTTTVKLVARIIASLLEFTPHKSIEGQHRENLTNSFGKLLSRWDDDRDRGVHIGLVFAGLKIYTQNKRIRAEKKYAKATLLCDLVFASLSAVPTAAPVFAVANVFADHLLERGRAARVDPLQQLEQKVREHYHAKVDFPMVADRCINIEGEPIEIERKTYRLWMDGVLEWCGFKEGI